MSEHTWVLENLAGYVVGGLDAEEREQLQEHLDSCADCARALAEVRAADRKLDGLFAGVRPNPALEDQSIQMLRRQPRRPGVLHFSRHSKVLAAAAAVAFLAFAGSGVGALIDQDRLQFPGSARNQLKQLALGIHEWRAQAALSEKSEAKEGKVPDLGLSRSLELKDAQAKAMELREGLQQRIDHYGFGDLGKSSLATDWSDSDGRRTSSSPLGTKKLADNERLGKEITKDASAYGLAFSQDGKKLASSVNLYNAPPPAGGKYELDRKLLGDFEPGKLYSRNNSPPTVQKAGDDSKQYAPAGQAPGRVGQAGIMDGTSATITEQSSDQPEKGAPEKVQPEKAQPVTRRVIRSGAIDFEVISFDDAVAVVSRLVNATKGGFIATINSDKLPNGKVRGAVVIRVPPDQLDRLVLDLRKEIGKAGELKGQRIGSQDITKQYTDLESRLRAARTMEERLLKIIRDGKGEIKDLVAAEKELGVWRTRVEEIEGELRYYNNLVSLSTLTVNLTEKNIRSAAAIDERERVQAGFEVEDVDQAYREALKAVTEAKGRITKSEVKQESAGQFSAVLHFEVEPEQAGPIRDRLKQLGNMVRLEIDRVQTAEGGGTAPRDGRIKRGPTQFLVAMYNLAKAQPRETQTLRLAAPDVPAAFSKLREILAKVKGRVLNAQLNEQDRQNVTAQLDFDIRRADEGTIQNSLSGAGETLSRHVGRVPEGENVTDGKVRFKVELLQPTAIPPREVITLALEVADVEGALAVLNAQVKEIAGRTVDSQVGQERNGRVTARVIADVPLTAEAGLTARLKSAGVVRVQRVTRNPQAPEGKLAVARLDVTFSNEVLLPRDEGLLAQVRNGLSFSLRGLSLSVSWLIVGVLFLLPWVLLVYAVVWLLRRLWRPEPAPATATATPAGTGTTSEAGS
jgi:anti-sigma factor RsiW